MSCCSLSFGTLEVPSTKNQRTRKPVQLSRALQWEQQQLQPKPSHWFLICPARLTEEHSEVKRRSKLSGCKWIEHAPSAPLTHSRRPLEQPEHASPLRSRE